MFKRIKEVIKTRLMNFIKKIKSKKAFSLVEITISLLVISIILAALTPTISSRLSATSSIKNRISTNCNSLYPDGYCGMCYITPKKCIVCTRNCASNQFKNVDNCICENCSTKYSNVHCTRCDSKKCTQCDSGYYLDKNNNCTICPKGSFCYQDGETSKMEKCKAGTVAPDEGMAACIKCAKSTPTQQGSVQTQIGQTACVKCVAGTYAKNEAQSSNCEACLKGHYCPNGTIIPCPKGTAQGETGQTICNACLTSSASQVGTYANAVGMSACLSCTDGNYANGNNAASCTTCPQGYYCKGGKIAPCPKGTAQGSTGQTGCVNCLKSTAAISGNVAQNIAQTACTNCSTGYYASVEAQQTQCNKCPAVNYYCEDGKIAYCPAGNVCEDGIKYNQTTKSAGASGNTRTIAITKYTRNFVITNLTGAGGAGGKGNYKMTSANRTENYDYTCYEQKQICYTFRCTNRLLNDSCTKKGRAGEQACCNPDRQSRDHIYSEDSRCNNGKKYKDNGVWVWSYYKWVTEEDTRNPKTCTGTRTVSTQAYSSYGGGGGGSGASLTSNISIPQSVINSAIGGQVRIVGGSGSAGNGQASSVSVLNSSSGVIWSLSANGGIKGADASSGTVGAGGSGASASSSVRAGSKGASGGSNTSNSTSNVQGAQGTGAGSGLGAGGKGGTVVVNVNGKQGETAPAAGSHGFARVQYVQLTR